MSTANEASTESTLTNPLTDLTGFQRELLIAVGSFEEKPTGQQVKDQWEQQNNEETTHGRTYPNLDTLVRKGLVEKGERNRRSNYYVLTEKGEQKRKKYVQFVTGE